MPIPQATMILNRQVIRLCKGALKAWEQWVDDMELEAITTSADPQPQIPEGKNNGRSMKR